MVDKVYSGDTTDIYEVGYQTSLEGVIPIVLADLTGNFSCTITVPDTTIDRPVTEKTGDNKRFRVYLTPDETAELPEGLNIIAVQIKNPTLVPPLIKEHHIRLNVLAGLNPNT